MLGGWLGEWVVGGVWVGGLERVLHCGDAGSDLAYCRFALKEIFKTKTMCPIVLKYHQTKRLLTKSQVVFLNFYDLKN